MGLFALTAHGTLYLYLGHPDAKTANRPCFTKEGMVHYLNSFWNGRWLQERNNFVNFHPDIGWVPAERDRYAGGRGGEF